MSATNVMAVIKAIDEQRVGFFEHLGNVADIMSTNVRTLSLDDNIQAARRLFREANIHHAPVICVDDTEHVVVGIVSDRDVLRATPRHLGSLSEEDGDQKAMSNGVAAIMTR